MGNTLRPPETFRLLDALGLGLNVLALGLMARMAAIKPIAWPFLFTLAVLLLKVPAVGRQLTLEALVGWLGAMTVLFVVPLRGAASRTLGSARPCWPHMRWRNSSPTPTTYLVNWIRVRLARSRA